MKKLFLLAAVAAIVACSKTDNYKETEEVAIDFSEVFIEKGTKAPYTDVASLQSDTRGFGVFGAKTKNSTTEKVIGKSTAETNGGAQVTYSNNKWTYSPKRYWDKGADSYQFYAYAPYNVATTANNTTTYLLGTVAWDATKGANGFSITGFKQNTTVANMVDILTDLENQTNVTTFQNNVNFSFKHILSNINFMMAVSPELKADENDNAVAVNSLTFGAVKMDGSYAYDNSTSKYKWTLAGTPTTQTFSATLNSNNKVFNAGELKARTNTTGNDLQASQISATPTNVDGLINLLFVPQTLPTDTKYVVTIEYTIGDEVFNKTINLNDFSKTENNATVKTSEWVSGYQYNYILVIGSTPIEFDVTGLSGWAQTDTYEYTIE